MKILSISILVLSLVSCGGGGGSGLGGGACSALSARDANSLALIDGEVCNQEARSPVVAIFPVVQNGDQLAIVSICSGTFVTVDDILTSAHCLVNPIQDFGERVVGFAVRVGGRNGEVIALSRAMIHPSYNGETGSRFDVAMITLRTVPSPRIGPVPILLSRLTAPGDRMSVFGYGNDNLGEVGTLKSGEVTIQDIIRGNLIVTLEDSDASLCGGDSGGPVVQIVDGITGLVGVNSFTASEGGVQCPITPSLISGFVDIQNLSVLEFIANYAPDVPFS